MKFDFVIGNPPYQEEYKGESSGANSVYDKFLEAGFELADKVLMIHPARFLFNAGSTSKEWNKKMLNDKHLKVEMYEPNSEKIFPMLKTPIKGGIAITYYDNKKEFEKIGIFTPYNELNSIIPKVKKFKPLNSIMVSSFAYHFTEKLHIDHPEVINIMSKGHHNDLKSNVFDSLSHIFIENEPDDGNDYIKILGRKGNDRVYRYIRRDYINNVINLDKYKIFISKANGTGVFGEILAPPIIAQPHTGSTETFLSIGFFESLLEAENTIKYIKSKFCRAMLNILKVTQDITPNKWAYVPLQDFTDKSDIDWTKSISDIDRQLYKKKKPNLANHPRYQYFH